MNAEIIFSFNAPSRKKSGAPSSIVPLSLHLSILRLLSIGCELHHQILKSGIFAIC